LGEAVKIIDTLLEFGVSGKIVELRHVTVVFLRFEVLKEFCGAADMPKVALKGMEGGLVGLAFTTLGIFGGAQVDGGG